MTSAQRIVQAFLNDGDTRTASKSEQEVERFLKALLPGTPWEGKTKAVGGYVRDQYLSEIMNDPSIEAKDLDIVVGEKNGSRDLTQYIYDVFNKKSLWDKFRTLIKLENPQESPVTHPHQMGADYPIWQITFKQDIKYKGQVYKTDGAVIEFADAMTESYPDPESRQRKTEPGTIEEDIERRDFTVNMLLKDLTTGEVEDLTGTSKEDIEKGILRGHPRVSLDTMFTNDPLRMLRICRFQAKYGWKVPLSVIKAVRRNAHRIEIVSAERIRGELDKISKIGKLKRAIRLLDTTGLLHYIMPEVEALKKVQQPEKFHAEGDVYKHTLEVLHNAKPGIENQMAALLHDIGKPSTQTILEDEIHFYEHDNAGAEIAKAILTRLKFDNDTRDKIVRMVKNHMRPHHLTKAGEPGLRKFIRELGDEMVDAVLSLAQADELGALPNRKLIPDLVKRIEEVRKKPLKVTREPVLDGHEIMQLLSLSPGPEVKRVKQFLLDKQDEYATESKELTPEEARKLITYEFK